MSAGPTQPSWRLRQCHMSHLGVTRPEVKVLSAGTQLLCSQAACTEDSMQARDAVRDAVLSCPDSHPEVRQALADPQGPGLLDPVSPGTAGSAVTGKVTSVGSAGACTRHSLLSAQLASCRVMSARSQGALPPLKGKPRRSLSDKGRQHSPWIPRGNGEGRALC